MTIAIRQYANGPAGTLDGTITDSATTLVVSSATGYPTIPAFTIRIDSEFMLVTALSGTTFTVTRATESSIAAPHTDGAPISMPLTVDSLEALIVQSHGGVVVSNRRQINLIDGGGVTWTLTDDPTNNKVDISAVASGGGGGGGESFEAAWTVPALTDYSWINQGTATASDDTKGIFLRAPIATQDNYRALVISTGSAPWTYTAKLAPLVFTNTNSCCGLIVSSGAGDQRSFILRLDNGSLDIVQLNSLTSWNSNTVTAQAIESQSVLTWLQINNDGTNLNYSVSMDGTHWTLFYSGSNSLGPLDYVGFFAESASGGYDACVKLVSAKLT